MRIVEKWCHKLDYLGKSRGAIHYYGWIWERALAQALEKGDC
jgi:hypothetical protein